MVVFRCRLEIGKYVFRSFINLKIDSSRKALTDTALIKLQNPGRKLDTALAVGDKVRIYLGYDETMNLEFQGYITKLRPNHPFEIECEDEMWKAKRGPVNIAWRSITLKNLMLYMFPGADVTNLPNVTLSPYRIDNSTKYDALEDIKKNYGFDIYFRNTPQEVDYDITMPAPSPIKLFAGLAYTDKSVINKKVKYNFGGGDGKVVGNVIPRNMSLAYSRKEDVRLLIKALSILDNGKKVTAEYGDSGGEIQTRIFYNIKTQTELLKLAKQELEASKFDGYSGDFKTWLIPFPQHGQIAEFKDPKYPEREGSNYIDSISTEISKSSGCRRTIKPGIRAL